MNATECVEYESGKYREAFVKAAGKIVCPNCKSTDIELRFEGENSEVYWLECLECLDTTPRCGHPVDAMSAWPATTPTDEEVK